MPQTCSSPGGYDEKEIRTHLDELVWQSVEDTLNALLNAEADAICQASRYQRGPEPSVSGHRVGVSRRDDG